MWNESPLTSVFPIDILLLLTELYLRGNEFFDSSFGMVLVTKQANIPTLLLYYFYNCAEFRIKQIKTKYFTPNSNMYNTEKKAKEWWMIEPLLISIFWGCFICCCFFGGVIVVYSLSHPILDNVSWQYSGWVSIQCTLFKNSGGKVILKVKVDALYQRMLLSKSS